MLVRDSWRDDSCVRDSCVVAVVVVDTSWLLSWTARASLCASRNSSVTRLRLSVLCMPSSTPTGMIVSRGGRDDGWNEMVRLDEAALGRSFHWET